MTAGAKEPMRKHDGDEMDIPRNSTIVIIIVYANDAAIGP